MLGDIVHNENVVNDINKAGAKVVDSVEDIPNDKKILFRAHGTTPDLWDKTASEKREADFASPLPEE